VLCVIDMNTLNFNKAIRQGGSNKTERHYLDFIVSGQSLKKLFGREKSDFITPFGWGINEDYTKQVIRSFILEVKSELGSGRVAIYVCPECGHIDCGAITAEIEDHGDKIVWKNFGYETDYNGLAEEYPEIKPIEFDKQNYLLAFSRL